MAGSGVELTERQVISKQRVADRGEVYTNKREVNAMLDLVKQETERIDARFLEPACGTGNFLVEILARKLCVVAKRYARSRPEYERYAVLAVSSLYGVDILADNVKGCRTRLFDIFDQEYHRIFGKRASAECSRVVEFILERNIVFGDALTLKTEDDPKQPIVFSEWSLVRGNLFKRRDFRFDALPAGAANQEMHFSDEGQVVFIPTPVQEYPPTHFLRIPDVQR